MKTLSTITALVCVALSSAPLFAWEMKQAPIMTPWAKEVGPKNALPEYPRPQLVRPQWLNLNGVWEFESVDGITKRIPASEWKGADESIFKKIDFGRKLSGEILVPFPVESALSGVMKHVEYMKYRRTFEIPADWKGSNVRLNFGAVDWLCDVYINGKLAGSHQGGYDAFSFDITKLLKGGKNEIIVSVYDPTDNGTQPVGKQRNEPEGYWYTPCSGIWQTVWLEPVKEGAIDSLKMIPNVRDSYLAVTVNAKEVLQTVELEAFANGKKVAQATGTANREIKLPIPNAKLWSPDSPFLYDLKITVKKDGKLVDKVDSYFGMREVSLKKIDGILRPVINGEFVFQLGTLDQGYWPDGNLTAPTDEALKSDIVNHKKLGFNLIRKHIKVEPARWFYWCDKIGMLVWQDMPSMHTHSVYEKKNEKNRRSFQPNAQEKALFEGELKEMIDEHISYPCIVTWILFNEGWGIYEKAEVKRLSDWLSAYDPSRLVNDSTGLPGRHASGDVYDIHIYQGPSASLLEPTAFSALGEFGGAGLNVKGHNWVGRGGWAYGDMNSSNAELTNLYVQMQAELLNLMYTPGLCASMYTQISDVEGETNGIYTYDRKVLKMDEARMRAANDRVVKASKNMPKLTSANAKLTLDARGAVSAGAEPKFVFVKNAKENAEITSAIVECSFMQPKADGALAGIVARYGAEGAYLMGVKSDGTAFISGLSPKGEIRELVEKKVEIKGAVKLKATVFGSSLCLNVNGENLFVKNPLLAVGKFGVFAQKASVRFGEFKISNPAKRFRAIPENIKFAVLREEKKDNVKKIRVHLDCNAKVMGDMYWEFEEGLADKKGVSIRSMSNPEKYLFVDADGNVYLEAFVNTPEFKKGATWYMKAGNSNEALNSFESMAFPEKYLRNSGWKTVISEVKSNGDKFDSTWEVME